MTPVMDSFSLPFTLSAVLASQLNVEVASCGERYQGGMDEKYIQFQKIGTPKTEGPFGRERFGVCVSIGPLNHAHYGKMRNYFAENRELEGLGPGS